MTLRQKRLRTSGNTSWRCPIFLTHVCIAHQICRRSNSCTREMETLYTTLGMLRSALRRAAPRAGPRSRERERRAESREVPRAESAAEGRTEGGTATPRVGRAMEQESLSPTRASATTPRGSGGAVLSNTSHRTNPTKTMCTARMCVLPVRLAKRTRVKTVPITIMYIY